RSLPPLSSGSNRSDLSHRIFMVDRAPHGTTRWSGQGLDTLSVDQCSIPELEIEEAPDAIPSVGPASCMVGEETVDPGRIDQSSFARAAIEQHISRHAHPCVTRPAGEGNGKSHLGAVEN